MNKHLLFSTMFFCALAKATAQMPTLVVDTNPGQFWGGLCIFDNKLLFSSYYDIWQCDGNLPAAVALPSVGAETRISFPVANNKLYFVARSSVQPTNDAYSLWYYDGVGSPVEVSDTLDVGIGHSGMALVGNKLFFAGIGTNTAYQHVVGIYYCDITDNTMHLAAPYNTIFASPTDTIAGISEMAAMNGRIYFIGITPFADRSEVFSYDTASQSVAMVTEYNPLNSASSVPHYFHVGDDNILYFSAYGSTGGRELFSCNGSDTAQQLTSLFSLVNGGGVYYTQAATSYIYSQNDAIFKWGNFVYFPGNDATGKGYELMRYDVTTHTTSIVKDINPGIDNSYTFNYCLYNGKLYFSAATAQAGSELWVSDGTADGTHMVVEMIPGFQGANPFFLTVYNGKLYFAAIYNATDVELFVFDGPAGIESVKKVNDIAVYPNPTTDHFTISINLKTAETLTLTLTNAIGKIVYDSPSQQCNTGANKLNVRLQHLPSGIYQYSIANARNELLGAGNITRN